MARKDRAEEALIKGRAQLSLVERAQGGLVERTQESLAESFVVGRGHESFSLLRPGSTAVDDSSLVLGPMSRIACTIDCTFSTLLISFSTAAYVLLHAGVFILTPTTRALTQTERTAVVLTLSLQVASLLHDAISRQRISRSERDTHLCIVVVKVLAALTNALLCFLPSTPFVVDAVTGRPNSMLRWVRVCCRPPLFT